MPFAATELTNGEKPLFSGSEMPEGMCEPARLHGSKQKRKASSYCIGSGGFSERKLKLYLIIKKRALVRGSEEARGSAPVDGSIRQIRARL